MTKDLKRLGSLCSIMRMVVPPTFSTGRIFSPSLISCRKSQRMCEFHQEKCYSSNDNEQKLQKLDEVIFSCRFAISNVFTRKICRTWVNAEMVDKICGDSYQCKYDYSTTLSDEFARFTKYYQDQFVNIYEEVLKPEAMVIK